MSFRRHRVPGGGLGAPVEVGQELRPALGRLGHGRLLHGPEAPDLVGEVEDLGSREVCGFTGPTEAVSWIYGFANQGEYRGGLFVLNQSGTRLVAIESLMQATGFNSDGVNSQGQTYEQFLATRNVAQAV